ncbi:hypothetical protein BDR26DRAFT_420780 [Obelidium mucronatum]|nr:hypothetical protein BDR26DRAFT_420780 [Obelidium mucronatum]
MLERPTPSSTATTAAAGAAAAGATAVGAAVAVAVAETPLGLSSAAEATSLELGGSSLIISIGIGTMVGTMVGTCGAELVPAVPFENRDKASSAELSRVFKLIGISKSASSSTGCFKINNRY